MQGLPAVPGFWCDDYWCKKDNIVETLNYILTLHSPDFPNTACDGFKIIELEDYVEIIPTVLRNKN